LTAPGAVRAAGSLVIIGNGPKAKGSAARNCGRARAVFAACGYRESLETPSFQGAPHFDIQNRPENRALQQQKLCRSRHPRFSAEDFEILSHDTNQTKQETKWQYK